MPVLIGKTPIRARLMPANVRGTVQIRYFQARFLDESRMAKAVTKRPERKHDAGVKDTSDGDIGTHIAKIT